MPRFEAHQPTPPSSFPPAGESSFVLCHVSKLTNPFLPLPPLQFVTLQFHLAMLQSSPSHSSLFLPSSSSAPDCDMPCLQAHQPIPPSSSPPVGESLFVSCRISKLTNLLLPLPPL